MSHPECFCCGRDWTDDEQLVCPCCATLRPASDALHQKRDDVEALRAMARHLHTSGAVGDAHRLHGVADRLDKELDA